jgi:hypothetical protein
MIPVLLALAAAGAPDPEAPFGLRMGQPVAEGAQSFKPGWYSVPHPPRDEPDLVKAAVEAFPETGICVVQGVSAEIGDDADGARTRAAIDAVAQRLSATYGAPQKLDACSGFACAPEDWTQDLQTGDRRYGYRWSMHAAPAHGVREASVVAVAHAARRAAFLVQWDSGDLTGCRRAQLEAGED